MLVPAVPRQIRYPAALRLCAHWCVQNCVPAADLRHPGPAGDLHAVSSHPLTSLSRSLRHRVFAT